MVKIDNQILSARKNLRNIYEKYTKEFYDITLKIDKYLGELEVKNAKEEGRD